MMLGGNEIFLWDLATGGIRKTLSPHRMLYGIKFYRDSNQLISAGGDTLKLWNINHDSGPRCFKDGSNNPLRLTFVANGGRLISEIYMVRASIWDVSTGQRLRTLGPDIKSVSADGCIVASAREHEVLLTMADSGEVLQTCRGHLRVVWTCQIAPRGTLVASGERDPQPTEVDAILWDAKSGRLLQRLPGHAKVVRQLAFSPDERILATVDDASVLRFWDVATGKQLPGSEASQREWATWPIARVQFSHDSKSLYASSAGVIGDIDVATGKLRRTLAAGSMHISIFNLSPDGKTLAVPRGMFYSVVPSKGGIVELWDVASGELKTTLASKYGDAWSAAFSPDGRTLATGHRDGTIALWQAATDDEVHRQAPP
jgi:WD40 repeat protein